MSADQTFPKALLPSEQSKTSSCSLYRSLSIDAFIVPSATVQLQRVDPSLPVPMAAIMGARTPMSTQLEAYLQYYDFLYESVETRCLQ